MYPTDSTERAQSIWLWFNKSSKDRYHGQIDLENFVRGSKPGSINCNLILQ